MVSGFLFVHLARGKLVGHRVPGGSALTSVLSLSLPLSYGILGRDIGRKVSANVFRHPSKSTYERKRVTQGISAMEDVSRKKKEKKSIV